MTQVRAGGHYNYALCEDSNEVYAWGMGENNVLGTRDDENEFEPKLVNPKQFLENRVCMIGTGIQHVVVLTTASKESSSRAPVLDKSALNERFELPKEEIKANGNVKPDQDESKQSEEPAKTEPVVEEAAEKQASAVEKVLSQKSEPKEVSQKSSQGSRSSKKRSAADLKASQ